MDTDGSQPVDLGLEIAAGCWCGGCLSPEEILDTRYPYTAHEITQKSYASGAYTFMPLDDPAGADRRNGY